MSTSRNILQLLDLIEINTKQYEADHDVEKYLSFMMHTFNPSVFYWMALNSKLYSCDFYADEMQATIDAIENYKHSVEALLEARLEPAEDYHPTKPAQRETKQLPSNSMGEKARMFGVKPIITNFSALNASTSLETSSSSSGSMEMATPLADVKFDACNALDDFVVYEDIANEFSGLKL